GAGDGAAGAGRVSNTRRRKHRMLPQLIFTSGAVTLHVPPDWTVVAALPFSVMLGAVRLSALAATGFSVAAALIGIPAFVLVITFAPAMIWMPAEFMMMLCAIPASVMTMLGGVSVNMI